MNSQTLRKWIKSLEAKIGEKHQFEQVLFRDLVYLAVKDPNPQNDRYEISRADCLSWEGVATQRLPDLQDEIVEDWATGLVKDYEWRHERESRLLIKMRKNRGRGIKVDIPDDVLENMRFTFSPWLSPNMEATAEKLITDALANSLGRAPKMIQQRFRRSVLTECLRLGDGRVPCAFCDSCKLFCKNAYHV